MPHTQNLPHKFISVPHKIGRLFRVYWHCKNLFLPRQTAGIITSKKRYLKNYTYPNCMFQYLGS